MNLHEKKAPHHSHECGIFGVPGVQYSYNRAIVALCAWTLLPLHCLPQITAAMITGSRVVPWQRYATPVSADPMPAETTACCAMPRNPNGLMHPT